jgi:stalled ribosome rescue protein Dom34
MTDVFNNGNASNSGAPAENTGDKPVFDFIGEGKQYADANTALAAIPHKDTHIAKIEEENANMQAQLAEGKTINDVLEAMKTDGTNVNTPPANQGTSTEAPDIAEIVKNVLQGERAANTAQGNMDSVNEFMTTNFGDKAVEAAEAKAVVLGMSMDELKGLAVRSPGAYKALFTGTKVEESITTTQSNVNTQAINDTSSSGMKKYQEVLKADKSKFLSADVQKAQMAEAMSDPAKFFNN